MIVNGYVNIQKRLEERSMRVYAPITVISNY